MAAPGSFDWSSISFDDEDTNPSAEKPDVNMTDSTPQSQAATSPAPKFGLDFNFNNPDMPIPQGTPQFVTNTFTPDVNSTGGTTQHQSPFEGLPTISTYSSPTDGTEEPPAKRGRLLFSNIPKPRASLKAGGPRSSRGLNSPAPSADSIDEMVANNEQSEIRAKQRIINQIRETARMTAVYKRDREIIESIGGVMVDAMQVFSELKAEHPVPFKAMVDMIEHLSPVFGFKPAP